MTVRSSTSNHHHYKVFVSVEPNTDKRDDLPSPMLKFECNVRITYVPNRADIKLLGHDSWCVFHRPYDMFTCDDNFASSQPRSHICQILDLMKIPFKLDRLFWKQLGHQGKLLSVPLEKPDDIVTLIMDAACAMADGVGVSQGKGLVLVVTLEKQVTVPLSEYVRILKEKQQTLLFCKVRDKLVKMLQLEEQGQEFPKSEWEYMVDVIVKSGLSEAMQNYLASLMKQNSGV
ncbi:hypothetical protein PTKIN_Ptkin12aG0085800 [Pterospermum kingtungense]